MADLGVFGLRAGGVVADGSSAETGRQYAHGRVRHKVAVPPNPIGLSSVTLEEVRLHTPDGPVLIVGGADVMDGTPIYDIKPYLPYADCHPDAAGGFAENRKNYALEVDFPPELEAQIAPEHRAALRGVLAHDPRPSYQSDPERLYGVAFAEKNVRCTVRDGVLTVREIEPLKEE